MSRIILTESQLSKIIKKVIKETNHPFERIAFADQRKEFPPGTEPNTPDEDKAFRELFNAIEHNGDLSPESLAAIKDSLDRGLHNDIIYYSRAPVYYRGLSFMSEDIKSVFGINPKELPEDGKSVFKLQFEFTPRKLSGISSWTSDYNVATEFAYSNSFEGPIQGDWSVVLVADSALNPKNFLDVSSLYEVLGVDETFRLQKECIALGPVKVSEIHIYGSYYEE